MSWLRKLQSDLEAETGNACFLGLSVASTIQQCLRLDNAKAALHVKSSFRVSERHFALLKVRSAAGPKLKALCLKERKQKPAVLGCKRTAANCKSLASHCLLPCPHATLLLQYRGGNEPEACRVALVLP